MDVVDGKFTNRRSSPTEGRARGGGKKARANKHEHRELVESTTGGDGILSVAEFIAPAVAQFLDVRSLARFGSTCKWHDVIMAEEIRRRKVVVAAIEYEVRRLMGTQPESVPARANVVEAKRLCDKALRLIKSHKKLGRRVKSSDDDVFLEERRKFVSEACKPLGSLVVLPDCFYFPPEGESSHSCQEAVDKALEKARRIWGAENLMGSVHEAAMWNPRWNRLDYERPFMKFHLPGAQQFTQFMEETAMDLAHDGTIDAFRIAARKVFFNAPALRDAFGTPSKRQTSSPRRRKMT